MTRHLQCGKSDKDDLEFERFAECAERPLRTRLTMAEAPKKKTLGRSIGIGLYFGIGLQVLTRLLEYFVTFSFALAISMLVLSLIAYPLFVRGYSNRWTKDKRVWTFPSFIIAVLAITIVAVVVIAFLLPTATTH